MNEEDMKNIVDKYIQFYNSFDVNGMLALVHEEIQFQNITGGEVNLSVEGQARFADVAQQATSMFTSRRQTITGFKAEGDTATVEIDYVGVLAADIPNGPKAGDSLQLKGRSFFEFRDGLIYKLTDYS